MARGATYGLIQRRLASGAWRLTGRGVFTIGPARPSWERELYRGVLSIDRPAVVTHEAAAARHELTGFPRGPVVLTVRHSGWTPIPRVTVHQINDLTDPWIVSLDGLRFSSVARTFVDLAPWVHPAKLRLALNEAVVAKRVTLAQVGDALTAVARRGKPGIRRLSLILDQLGPGESVGESVLERELFRLLKRFGLPEPVLQMALPGRGHIEGCVDGAYPAAKLILEADGRRWHARAQDLLRDRERDMEAARVGWLVLRLLHEHICGDPEGTAEIVHDTLAVRLRQVA